MQVFIDLMLLLPSFSSSTYGVDVLGSSTFSFLSQYDPSDFSSLSLSLSSLNLRSKTIHYQRQLRFLTWVEKEMKIRGRRDNGASNCYSSYCGLVMEFDSSILVSAVASWFRSWISSFDLEAILLSLPVAICTVKKL